ncbi:MAG: flavodoxin family protein [Coriobacteriia bacterium]|nr:flavodoxin family protein [Coriobacteriia bacterium]
MRIIAIDASTGRGVVSRSVEVAARAAEAAGATVERVRLAEYDVRYCTGCKMCRLTGTCKIDDDLPDLAERIALSDGVIFGVPSYFKRAERPLQAVLDRLSGYFSSSGQLRLPGFSEREVPSAPQARAARRAVIITATSAPEPIATFFGYTSGPIRELRTSLAVGGIQTIGSLAVSGRWTNHQLDEWENDKACSLGRVLAGRI